MYVCGHVARLWVQLMFYFSINLRLQLFDNVQCFVKIERNWDEIRLERLKKTKKNLPIAMTILQCFFVLFADQIALWELIDENISWTRSLILCARMCWWRINKKNLHKHSDFVIENSHFFFVIQLLVSQKKNHSSPKPVLTNIM